MHALAEEDHKTIPDGWEEKTIGSLCHIWSGGTPSKSEPSFWQGDIPWVSGKDLKAPTLSDSIDHISPEGLRAACRLAPTGAVFLLVRGMGLAKDLPISVANRPMAFNQDIKALVSRTALSGSFIRSAVYHAKDRLMSRIVPSAHGTMTLNLDDVENISILVPGKHEECDAIASVLDLAQSAILAERRLLDTTAEFKRSAMRELFTHGLHGEAQKETEIGVFRRVGMYYHSPKLLRSSEGGFSIDLETSPAFTAGQRRLCRPAMSFVRLGALGRSRKASTMMALRSAVCSRPAQS